MSGGAGFSQDQQGLLTIRRAIRNWDLYYRRSSCTGWVAEPGSDVCTWTGVVCRNGSVVVLRFPNNQFQRTGEAALHALPPGGQACSHTALLTVMHARHHA